MLKAISTITNALGALNYKGTWNASSNTPTLADGTGAKGDYYVTSTAGTQTFGGLQLFFGIGDWIVYNGAVWQRVEGGSDGNFSNVTLTSTDAGATAAPLLDLYRDSATPAASDTIGEIEFNGEDSVGNKQQYAVIHAAIVSPTTTAEGGQLHFETTTSGSSTEKMRIGTSGDVSVLIGNLVISTSGKGIDFSATSSGSGTMTSELFADYEEGTWTPTLIGGTTNPTVTYSLQRAKYTKIGRVATVECYLSWSAFTGGSGQLRLDGLPFTVSSAVPNTSSVGALMNMNGITLTAGRTFGAMQAVGGTTYCVIRNLGSAVTGTNTDISATGATGELGFTISYVAA